MQTLIILMLKFNNNMTTIYQLEIKKRLLKMLNEILLKIGFIQEMRTA